MFCPMRLLLIFFIVQPEKEVIVGAAIELFQADQNAGTNVQLASLIFRIGCPANITPPALQFRTQFFLRYFVILSELFQIIPHIPVASDFLFHSSVPPFLTSIGCNMGYFMVEWRKILSVILVNLEF